MDTGLHREIQFGCAAVGNGEVAGGPEPHPRAGDRVGDRTEVRVDGMVKGGVVGVDEVGGAGDSDLGAQAAEDREARADLEAGNGPEGGAEREEPRRANALEKEPARRVRCERRNMGEAAIGEVDREPKGQGDAR